MSIKHANPSEVIHLQPLGSEIGSTKTSTLFKTEVMEAIRLVLPAGKQIAEHKAPGEISVFCLEGRVNSHLKERPKNLLLATCCILLLPNRMQSKQLKIQPCWSRFCYECQPVQPSPSFQGVWG